MAGEESAGLPSGEYDDDELLEAAATAEGDRPGEAAPLVDEGEPAVAHESEDEGVEDELLEAAALAEEPPGPATEASDLDEGEGLPEHDDPATLAAQRDEYREALQRLKAEFDNFRKRVDRDRQQTIDRALGNLAEALLPVLDACDAAVVQGSRDVQPVLRQLLEALGREGLEPIAADGAPFDPTRHEAVMHEPGEGDEGPVVVESLRTGYLWRGDVLRPAMVKVRG